jgi:hypothetical protein
MAYQLNLNPHINPELTARDWELYSSMAGSKGAARKLNKALKDAVNSKGSTPQSVVMAMHPVMRELANFGADDTEPRYHLQAIIQKVYGYTYD